MDKSENSKIWYLENFNIMDSLSKKELMILNDITSMKDCHKNEIIYLPKDKADSIYFLQKGKVKIYAISDDGREMIQTILTAGEIFGELAVTGEGDRGYVAETMEDALMCRVGISEFKQLLNNNLQLNFNITKLIGFRFRKIQNKLESLWFKTAPERIKSFIKDLVDEYGKDLGEEKVVSLNLTHQDIANLTATTRQTVTTTFKELEKEEIISYNRKKIFIRKYDKL